MRYKIALVDYLNTLPFSEGLRLTGMDQRHDIFRVPPAACADLFNQGDVEISLCPVGALEEMPAHRIISDYGIGAEGPVRTVMLLSRVPWNEITSVRLDDQSRTSNLLLQILADRFWKKDWTYYSVGANGSAESCLLIGDKVWDALDHYPYQYDLAGIWKELTALPMVFAVWIARPDVKEEFVDELNTACEAGLKYVLSEEYPLKPWEREYLTRHISFMLDPVKRKAIKLFEEWSQALTAKSSSR
jgi:chorismate dehydratase